METFNILGIVFEGFLVYKSVEDSFIEDPLATNIIENWCHPDFSEFMPVESSLTKLSEEHVLHVFTHRDDPSVTYITYMTLETMSIGQKRVYQFTYRTLTRDLFIPSNNHANGASID